MSKTDKQLALELEGTDPSHWEAAGFDDATLTSVLGTLSDSALTRVLETLSDSALTRVLGAMSSSNLARILGALSGPILARILGSLRGPILARVLEALSDSTLTHVLGGLRSSNLIRVLGAMSDSDLTRIKSILDLINPIENPYTTLLAQIKQDGCSLDMGTWHTCNTTHCLAGWVVTLAKNGTQLEKLVGTPGAAALILKRSRPEAPLPSFSASNAAAMAFIEARVKEEQAAAVGEK